MREREREREGERDKQRHTVYFSFVTYPIETKRKPNRRRFRML